MCNVVIRVYQGKKLLAIRRGYLDRAEAKAEAQRAKRANPQLHFIVGTDNAQKEVQHGTNQYI